MSMSVAGQREVPARQVDLQFADGASFSIGAETIVKVPLGLSVETTFFFAPRRLKVTAADFGARLSNARSPEEPSFHGTRNGERRVPWSQVFRIPAVGDGERSAMATFVASTEQKSDSPVSFLQLRGVGPFAQRSKRLNRPCRSPRSPCSGRARHLG